MIYFFCILAVLLDAQEDSRIIQFFEHVCESQPISLFEQHIIGYFKKKNYAPVDLKKPNTSLEKMGHQFLLEAKIPQQRAIEFYALPKRYPFYENILAMAAPFGIFLNEDALNKLSYGQLRYVFFHEAMHINYNHNAMPFIVMQASIFCYLALTNKYTQKAAIKYRIYNGIAAAIFGNFVALKSHPFFERRADIHAIKLLDCTDCVKETTQLKSRCDKDPHGYLNRKEFIAYNKLFNPQNNLCTFHLKAHQAKIMNDKRPNNNWFFYVFNKNV